ncbi:MAG: gliding motility protein GldN [Bacteroidia bacterium]|jgi:gliding motility associated protien GldN|nr:gliding motility protein GldN [Bacteroidia bacterium]
MKRTMLIFMTCMLIVGASKAQISAFEDFTYPHTAVKERKAIPYRYIREANVKWSKRIHRIIDVREKQNKVMHWPRNPFYLMIWNAAMDGDVVAYANDSLTSIKTPEDILKEVSIETTVQIPNPENPGDPYDLISTTVFETYEPEQIAKYRLMEDWIFDFNYSDFRARIIAIAPLIRLPTESGVDLGEVPIYWLKMEDLRDKLVQQEVFNAKNDAARMSFDHWFQMRQFSSYIVKESNMYDLDIAQFEEFRDDGVEALLESDRIKNDLFILEHDLWEY